MADRSFGAAGGYLTTGTVVNIEDDPSQTGRVKVRWKLGGAAQPKEWGDNKGEDLPWTTVMFSPNNPSTKSKGGPHTGLRVGSVVWGQPADAGGQEYIIVGSTVAGGNNATDEDAKYDSNIPLPAKTEKNGEESQSRYGDKNPFVDDEQQSKDQQTDPEEEQQQQDGEAIWKYGRDKGGEDKKAARYYQLEDSIGWIKEISEEDSGGGSGGATS